MNERIKELLIKAIKEVGPDDNDRGAKEKTLQKFAELIVRECAEVSSWNGDGELSGMIKNHFGVEE